MLRIEPPADACQLRPQKSESKNRLGDFGPGVELDWLCIFCAFGAFLWRVLTFIGSDSLGQRVAMDAEHGGGVGNVLLVTREGLLYIELLEFLDGLFQKDVAFEHFVNKAFESVVNQSSFPVSSL